MELARNVADGNGEKKISFSAEENAKKEELWFYLGYKEKEIYEPNFANIERHEKITIVSLVNAKVSEYSHLKSKQNGFFSPSTVTENISPLPHDPKMALSPFHQENFSPTGNSIELTTNLNSPLLLGPPHLLNIDNNSVDSHSSDTFIGTNVFTIAIILYISTASCVVILLFGSVLCGGGSKIAHWHIALFLLPTFLSIMSNVYWLTYFYADVPRKLFGYMISVELHLKHFHSPSTCELMERQSVTTAREKVEVLRNVMDEIFQDFTVTSNEKYFVMKHFDAETLRKYYFVVIMSIALVGTFYTFGMAWTYDGYCIALVYLPWNCLYFMMLAVIVSTFKAITIRMIPPTKSLDFCNDSYLKMYNLFRRASNFCGLSMLSFLIITFITTAVDILRIIVVPGDVNLWTVLFRILFEGYCFIIVTEMAASLNYRSEMYLSHLHIQLAKNAIVNPPSDNTLKVKIEFTLYGKVLIRYVDFLKISGYIFTLFMTAFFRVYVANMN